MKWLAEENGHTLIELLAALAISIMIFGVTSMALMNAYKSLVNIAAEENDDYVQISFTLDTLSRYLTDCTEIFYPAPAGDVKGEVRMKRYKGAEGQQYEYWAFHLKKEEKEGGHKLYLYELVDVDDTNFTGVLAAANYANRLELADNVADMKVSSHPANTRLQNGETFTIEITFDVADGPKKVEKVFKLLKLL